MNDVTLYGASWCPYCVTTKKFHDTNGVTYQYRDVDHDGVRLEMNKLTAGNQTIPVVFIGEQYWVNPSASLLKEKLHAGR